MDFDHIHPQLLSPLTFTNPHLPSNQSSFYFHIVCVRDRDKQRERSHYYTRVASRNVSEGLFTGAWYLIHLISGYINENISSFSSNRELTIGLRVGPCESPPHTARHTVDGPSLEQVLCR